MENNSQKEQKKEGVKINKKVFNILIALLVVGAVGGPIYYYISQQTVYTDRAEISAQRIDLSPTAPGVLEEIMVKPGDQVDANAVVARVGSELIKTKSAGVIVDVHNDFGKNISPGEPVVSMIDPADLRAVAHIDEDKGLDQVHIGQRAVFTVDVFGSKKYVGTVDEISPIADQSSIVFNISDKREVKQFDVKIRFDTDQYSELKDGMSARVWIYKK